MNYLSTSLDKLVISICSAVVILYLLAGILFMINTTVSGTAATEFGHRFDVFPSVYLSHGITHSPLNQQETLYKDILF